MFMKGVEFSNSLSEVITISAQSKIPKEDIAQKLMKVTNTEICYIRNEPIIPPVVYRKQTT